MIHLLLSSFFFVFTMVDYSPTKEKLLLNIVAGKTDMNSVSPELFITTTIKNQSKKAYYIYRGKQFTTCSKSSNSFFWLVEIRFEDSTELYDSCPLVKIRPFSKWMSSKLERDSSASLICKVNLNTLFSQDDFVKGVLQNSHFGNYSVTVSYFDRDLLNNKSRREIFTSNKIYFTYQK